MEQRNRPGGNDGLGYYTSWDKSKEKGCIYCGDIANTREHIPSKTFLNSPYPENLSTIPACYKCNNGYSKDEKYVSCFLDVLKSCIYINHNLKDNTIRCLKDDIGLKKLIEEQIDIKNDHVYFSIDDNKIKRILVKLAKGHAAFELDYINFDDVKIDVKYDFIFNLSKEFINSFNNVVTYPVIHEVGSRAIYLIQDLDSGFAETIALWNIIQNQQYRYQVVNRQSSTIVKIVIFEFLYSEICFN